MTVTDSSGATASTPVGRELYVQSLLSQNRNQVLSITGPAALTVGDEVTFVLNASTAPNGYEQLESFLTQPSSIFELLSVTTTYDGPPRTTTDLLYADACGWDNDPASPTYLSCVGPETIPGGKAGGALLIEYRVRAVGPGSTILSALIYDKSGASYHYNADFGIAPNLFLVTVAAPRRCVHPDDPAPVPGVTPDLPGGASRPPGGASGPHHHGDAGCHAGGRPGSRQRPSRGPRGRARAAPHRRVLGPPRRRRLPAVLAGVLLLVGSRLAPARAAPAWRR